MSPSEALPIGLCSWSLQVTSVPELAVYLQRLGLRQVHIACGDPQLLSAALFCLNGPACD